MQDLQTADVQVRTKCLLPVSIGSVMFLAAVLLPSEASAFRLIQITAGAGTYTASSAVAPTCGIRTVRWGVQQVPWNVNANGAGDGLTFAQTQNAVLGALQAWEDVYPANLNLRMNLQTNATRNATDNLNTVYWLRDPLIFTYRCL
jgi:hypothetical protein